MQKNKELWELVTTLQDGLARCDHHIKNYLATKANELIKENMKLNKKLQEIGEQKGFNQQLLDRSLDVPDGQASEDKPNVSCTEMVTSMVTSSYIYIISGSNL